MPGRTAWGRLPCGAVWAALVAVAASEVAHADPAGVINALRAEGCARVPAAGSPARRDSALDAAARELAGNTKLADALARVGYEVASSSSFHIRGARDDASIRRMLEAEYCERINDPKLVELGVHQSGDSTWIVMAGRSERPFTALRDPASVAQRVLELVNAARAEPRRCGGDRFEPAPPLAMATTLTAAASLHSLDMATRGRLGHDGSDGSEAGERLTHAGYTWQISGENVAAGQHDADAVVAAWLQSPGHCATLMDARYTETGVAFALAPGKNPAVYWTQAFAAPR
ncbi:MAG TPA: CAP domain-containing protein [Gammaproteobacteria bacterium]|nr:CAP domain-containing protein [Gammaproteobacteria bacterium]